MFAAIEAFVTAHRGCGELTADVGELAAAGYTVRLVCTCGAELVPFYHGGRREQDLLRSSLAGCPN